MEPEPCALQSLREGGEEAIVSTTAGSTNDEDTDNDEVVFKTCRVCKVKKHPSEFYNDRNRSDGRTPECKACRAEYRTEYRLAQDKRKKDPGEAKEDSSIESGRDLYVFRTQRLVDGPYRRPKTIMSRRWPYSRGRGTWRLQLERCSTTAC